MAQNYLDIANHLNGKKMYKLGAYPEPNTHQHRFETGMYALGIRTGAMAVNADLTKYVNDHVQWMWMQFKQKVGVE